MCRWSDNHCCGVERDGTCMWCSLYSLCWLNFINIHECAGVSALERDIKRKEKSGGY